MNELDDRYLCFQLAHESYAMQLLTVKEVIAYPEITSIPQAPTYFLGIMNLRGQVISIIDLRQKFGLKAARTPETCVIICEFKGYCIGVVVDQVSSVMLIHGNELNATPEIHNGKKNEYISGVINKEEKMILALDILKALDIRDEQILMNINKAA